MGDPPTIAVVDDDEGVRLATLSLLRSYGFDALVFGSGAEFLAETTSQPPDCMICDIQMPDMTGPELVLRLTQEGRRYPVIFVTAFATQELRRLAIASGGVRVLEKPSSADDLIAEVEKAIAGSWNPSTWAAA